MLIAAAFFGLWLIPGATTTVAPFLILFGATYFFSEFGPNTTTFVYPAEIFPVRVRTTSHGIAAAAGKIGAFIGTYALTSLLPRIGLGDTSAIVGVIALAGAIVTHHRAARAQGTKPGNTHRGRRRPAGQRHRPRPRRKPRPAPPARIITPLSTSHAASKRELPSLAPPSAGELTVPSQHDHIT